MSFTGAVGAVRQIGATCGAAPGASGASSGNGFDKYMKAVRSAGDRSRASAEEATSRDDVSKTEAPEARESKKRKSETVKSPESDSGDVAETTPVVIVAVNEASVLTLVENVVAAAPAVDGAAQAQAVSSEESARDAARGSAGEGAVARTGEGKQAGATKTAAPVQQAAPDEARLDAASDGEASFQEKVRSDPNAVLTAKQTDRPRSDTGIQSNDLGKNVKAESKTDGSVERNAATRTEQKRSDGPRQGSGADEVETAYDRRVQAILRRAEAGGSDAKDEGQNKSKQDGSTAGPRAASRPVGAGLQLQDTLIGNKTEATKPSGLSKAGEIGADVELRGVRSGSGDGAAAAVGRFLLGDAASVGAGLASQASDASGGRQAVGHPVLTAADQASGAPGSAASATLGDLIGTEKTTVDGLFDAARVLRSAGGPGRWEVNLQLEPPALGQLKLMVRMEHDAMTLRVQAEASSVGRLIESRLPELREALASHGIRIDRTEIVVAGEGAQQAAAHSRHQPQNPDGQRQESQGAGDGWASGADGNWEQAFEQASYAPDRDEAWAAGADSGNRPSAAGESMTGRDIETSVIEAARQSGRMDVVA